MLVTARMRLIPATHALVAAELTDPAAFAAMLGATVPDSWPPELLRAARSFFLQRLAADAALVGWLIWYGLVVPGPDTAAVLAASGGFMGSPRHGTIEIGYSVLPEFQNQGYASEMGQALIGWARQQPGVRRVIAEVDHTNMPSQAVLRRLGLMERGVGSEPELRLYSLNLTAESQ